MPRPVADLHRKEPLPSRIRRARQGNSGDKNSQSRKYNGFPPFQYCRDQTKNGADARATSTNQNRTSTPWAVDRRPKKTWPARRKKEIGETAWRSYTKRFLASRIEGPGDGSNYKSPPFHKPALGPSRGAVIPVQPWPINEPVGAAVCRPPLPTAFRAGRLRKRGQGQLKAKRVAN